MLKVKGIFPFVQIYDYKFEEIDLDPKDEEDKIEEEE